MMLRCGRLGEHEPHHWTPGRNAAPVYTCTGYVLTEGAYAEYARQADEDDARWEADQAARRDAEAVES